MKYRFSASAVVEANSEEDAIAKIGARMSVIGRHVGNGSSVAETKPFFTLSSVSDETEATDLSDLLTSEDNPPYPTDEPTPADEAGATDE